MSQPKFETHVGSSVLTVELTDLAGQANGRALVRYGDTVVLVTAVMSKQPREGGDFFPLTVDYEEKFYAAGKILGSRFVKRESRPSEEAILTARLIDRTIRPRFDLAMRNEVQVVATVLSYDEANDPDMSAIFGASIALATSDIPWDGPIAAARIGWAGGSWIVNPTIEQRKTLDLDIVVSGTADKINMCEAGGREVPEGIVVEALEKGQQEIKKLAAFAGEIIAAAPKKEKRNVALVSSDEATRKRFREEFGSRVQQSLWEKDKLTRNAALEQVRMAWNEFAAAEFPDLTPAKSSYLWEEIVDATVHEEIIKKGERPDGRAFDELRPLSAMAGILPRVHGCGLFVRGETQALSSLTLGAPGDQQLIEGMEIRTKRHFMHHYNFPPYSTGEIKPLRGPGRREIGHGALAERALLPLIPSREKFPYTIRIVSEILSSNGSSSMASVCGSSLALFDAGVPVEKPVAGIAMGLMMESAANYRVLTDIQGPEDHYGDMDFKAAGTRDGVTAVQMDVKIDGVTVQILKETLQQARKAREEILAVMERVLPRPRPELSPLAPRIAVLKIDPQKIGLVIGPGGKTINAIVEQTGATIDIEDDGSVFVTAANDDSLNQAVLAVKQITREFIPGEVLEGTVSRIFDFGAMVEVGPKQEGLIHTSELAPWHVGRVEDIVNIGDKIPVMVKNIDEQGRLNLSLKSVPGQYSAEDIERGRAQQSSRPEGQGRPFDRHASGGRGRGGFRGRR